MVSTSKFQNAVYKFLLILCIVFFTYIFLFTNSVLIKSYSYPVKHTILMFYVICFILLVIFSNRFLKDKYFPLFLLLFSFIIRLIWILTVETPIISDFGNMYFSATKAVAGDFEWA